ncbi:hypothetical protein H4R34_005254 [Dimargaris verticillata]|uniref:HMG box domain-containing protein n=1 Tax=Dimargaris verticillata TaxID=2761393 RepID=A0A9W8B0Y9_9FUNG|nr:hypothetical protein H4R34_005254 [Dimargaris verticillata]
MSQPSLEHSHAPSHDARANAFHYQYHGSTPTQFQLQSMNHLQAMSHRAGSGDTTAKVDTSNAGGNDKDDKHHGYPSLSGTTAPSLKLESDSMNGCDENGKSSHGPQQGSSGQSSAASSTPTTPRIAPPNTYKRFRNAFIYFVNEQRKARNPGQQSIKNREFVQMMSLEWRALSEDEKKPYTDMARLDRERYDKDVETHGRIPPKPAKSSLQSKSAGLSNYSNQNVPSINFTDWRTLPHDMTNQHYQFMGATRDPNMYHLPMEHFSKLGHRPGEPMQSYDYLLYNYPHTPNKVMGVTHSLPNSMPNTPGLPTPGGHTPNPVSDVTPPPAMDHRASAAAGPYMNGGGGGQGFPTPSISTPNSAIPSPQSHPHGGSSQPGVSGARHNSTMTSLLPSTTQNMPHPSLLQPSAQGFYPPHGAPHAPSTLSNPNGHHGSNLPPAGHSTNNGVSNYGFTHGAVSSMVPLGNPYSSHAAMAAVHNAQGMGMQQPHGSSAQGLAPQMDVNGLSLGHNVNNNIQMINGVPTMLSSAPGTSDASGNVVSGPGIQPASYMVTGAGPQPATAGSVMAETKLSRTKSVRTKKEIKNEL